jgi:GAF domain-containing protein
LTDVESGDSLAGGHAVLVPIAFTGEPLGSLVIEMKEENKTPQNMELVNIVARQVGQQIENLRLLESAERYRLEADQAAQRATIEGWQEFMRRREGRSLGYLYDTREVRPVEGEPEDPALTLPLKTRDQAIGKLSIQGISAGDQDSLELANAVAERLSAHIESLRLFEETKRGQVELDKRARELEAVAEISTVSSREVELQRMLETVVYLTQRRFGLYHAHVFVFNEQTKSLDIVACGWKQGDEHEGTHGTAKIPLDQEQSLVARAGRMLRPVIVNDTRSDPGWLPNPLLPDTASEMAIPLVVGDQLLGVLDVQSDRRNAFTEEDASIQATLAAQVATSMQNARSFANAQKQAQREAMLNAISQKIQSATTVEAVLQIAARELGHALGAPLTVAQLGVKDRD